MGIVRQAARSLWTEAIPQLVPVFDLSSKQALLVTESARNRSGDVCVKSGGRGI